MSRSCPWCREELPGASGGALVSAGAPRCPRCGRPLAGEDGAELRPIDVRHDEVARRQRERFVALMRWGTSAAALLALANGLLAGISSGVFVPLCVAAHLVALRLVLMKEPRALLGGRRRFFVRWIGRLAVVAIGGVGYSLTAFPFIGAVFGAAAFAGATAAVHRYAEWSLRRELERQPLAAWEKAVLALLVAAGAGALLFFAAFLVLLYWIVEKVYTLFFG